MSLGLACERHSQMMRAWIPTLEFLVLINLVVVFASNAGSFLTSGDDSMASRHYSAAIKHYTSFIELDPEASIGYSKRAAAYIKQRKFREALLDLNKSITFNPNYVQGYLQQSQLLRETCQFEEAEQTIRKALDVKPEHAGAKKELSLISQAKDALHQVEKYYEEGQFTEAEEHLDKVLSGLSSECRQARLFKTRILLKKRDYGGVISETGVMLKVDDDDMDALLLRGQAYYHLSDFDVATRHYQKGLRLDPEHSSLKKEYFKLKNLLKKTKSAEDYLAKSKYRMAVEQFNAALAVDPEHEAQNLKLYLGLSKTFVKLGRGQEALKACASALEIDSENAEALSQSGEAKIILEDWDGAVQDLKNAYQKSQSRDIREALHRAERGLKLSKRKDWYKILGIEKTASAAEIKRAYKKLALKWHPDKNVDNKEEAAKQFQEIAAAYEILGDEEKRTRYDRGEDEEPQMGSGFNPFGGGFGGGPGGQTFTFTFEGGFPGGGGFGF